MKTTRTKRDDDDEQPQRDQPPDDFIRWWCPTDTNEKSGASIGGHPDAARMWARKEPGRWMRRAFGMTAVTAWACQCYRSEYHAWIAAGRPEPLEPFVSIAVPHEEANERMKEIMLIMRGEKDA